MTHTTLVVGFTDASAFGGARFGWHHMHAALTERLARGEKEG